jgi:rubredoxin
MKQRFKDKAFDKTYWRWVKITPVQVHRMFSPGSNRDQAFRDGFVGYRCKYQRNWILYPIYIAGKEWRKVNKDVVLCPDCTAPVVFQHEMNTDWYGILKYYKCPTCKEKFVSQNDEQIEIAAP